MIPSIYKQYVALKSSGVFLERFYSDCNGVSPLWRQNPILHYLLIGEGHGCRPNPFFDPTFFTTQTGVRPSATHSALWHYLSDPSYRRLAPSREFAPEWYMWQNPDWSKEFDHPFLHYWFRGIPECRDPAPGIDFPQLRKLVGASAERQVEKLYQDVCKFGRANAVYAIYSPAEMAQRREMFYNAIKLIPIRETSLKRRSRFLVFVQAGRDFNRGFVHQPRDFDVLINYYQAEGPRPELPVEHAFAQAGTKTTAIRKLLSERPELLTSYNAVLYLDDDIELSSDEVSQFFNVMEQEGLDLAQPSLTPESDCVWPVFKQPTVGPSTRLTNSVEIMMPALSRRAIEVGGWAAAEAVSGFGVDLLLGYALERAGGGKSGVVGQVAARHLKRIDDKGGAFYEYMRASGINPKFELWCIMQKFGIEANFHYLSS